MNHIIAPRQFIQHALSSIPPSLFPPCQPPTVPTTRAAHPLYFGFPFFRLSTPTHPPFQPPLPTPVINFSTEPPPFFLVSSLLSLEFPLLFFSPIINSFVSPTTRYEKKGVGFTVSAYSRFTKAWYRSRGSATRRYGLETYPEFTVSAICRAFGITKTTATKS